MSTTRKQPSVKGALGDSDLRAGISERIAEGIRRGDESAFAEYYAGVQEGLVTFVARMTGDADEALHIAHDALIKLWEQRERITQPNGFIYTTATNASLDLIRKRGVHKRYVQEQAFVLDAEAPAADDPIIYDELEAKIEKIIDEMPPQRRKVFEMSRNEHLTYNEIAERLDVSYNTVMKHMQAALKELRAVVSAVAILSLLG